MRLIDIGINLMSRQFDRDRDDVVARARAAGVERLVITGTDLRSSEAAKAYMDFGAGPRACVGQQLALTLGSLLLAAIVHAADEEGLLDDE